MSQKVAIPAAIVVAGILIAGAVVWSMNSDSSGKSASTVTAADLSYDKAQMESLIAEVGVNGKVLGDTEAPVRIVEYSDTECPFCQRYHDTMKQVMSTYGTEGQVAWEFKHFPIAQLHSKAPKEAAALECIYEIGGDEAFWIGVDTIFTITPGNDGLDHDKLPAIAETAGVDRDEFTTCLDSGETEGAVDAEFQEARAKGANGTPYSVLELAQPITPSQQQALETVDSQIAPDQQLFVLAEDNTEVRMSGAMPFQVMQQVLDVLLGSA